jgi:2-hydroxycyclohexanecarboxyl-CoA dehydrogenase
VDATDLDSVRHWVSAAERELGPASLLCNCVGWAGPMRPFLETSPEEWPAILDLELMAGLRLAAVAVPGMVERGWGRVVNLASDSAKAGESGLAVSAAGRGGLAAFGRSLARELARHRVTVNTVCPGPVETPALEALAASPLGERLLPAMLRAVPLRRAGRPEEVAALFAFLCSEDAGYMTGQTLSVSGGLTMS